MEPVDPRISLLETTDQERELLTVYGEYARIVVMKNCNYVHDVFRGGLVP